MSVDATDRALLAALEEGLPLVPRPYRALGLPLGLGENEVIARLEALLAAGVIKRLGVVVRHRALGYTANAMVVWDVPDTRVGAIGPAMAGMPFVTLCYRRPRRPTWPYNLFCMIHGRERALVHQQIAAMRDAIPGLADIPFAVLFSTQAFKQQGARYGRSYRTAEAG